MYTRIKKSNSLVSWTLDTAAVSLNTALGLALPSTVAIFGAPINAVDKLLCKSLDIVEQKVPNIYLPPHLMYWQTKQYVSSTFVRPVLKRADSVKQIGNSVLESKYTSFAAGKLENALNVADMYVDKYLPDVADQAIDDIFIFYVTKEAEKTKAKTEDELALPAVQTIHHVDRFSRKLQRRLTKRTLAEAKALKERSQESIHVLLYVAELIATDPKQALEKARQLWTTLSQNEPENQARPENLEQLIVMLTRESARRIVHFVNFTREAVGKLPVTISKGVQLTSQQCRVIMDNLVKNFHLDEITSAATNGLKTHSTNMSVIFRERNIFANILLEKLALSLAGHSDPKKPIKVSHSPKNNPSHQHHQVHHRKNHQKTYTQNVVSTQSTPVVSTSQYRVAHQHFNSLVNNGTSS